MGTVRFLVALWVVFAHSKGSAILGVPLFSGVTAVQCFYCISGFLITHILNERTEYKSLRNFYLSRYLRLWPPYILVAVATLALLKIELMFRELPATASIFSMLFLWIANLTIFFQDWTMFLRFDHGALVPTIYFGGWPVPRPDTFLLVPQAWTLGVELTFYLIAPFVCRQPVRLIALLLFGLGVRMTLAWYGVNGDPWMYRFAPSEMLLFAAGGLAYFAGRSMPPRFPIATKAFGLACIAVFACLTFASSAITPIIFTWTGDLNRPLALMYWPVLLFTVIAVSPLFHATRDNKIDRFLGEMSYPMYICHILVGQLVAMWAGGGHWLDDGNLTYGISVVAVSAFLVVLVIKPLDDLRGRFGARTWREAPVKPRPSPAQQQGAILSTPNAAARLRS